MKGQIYFINKKMNPLSAVLPANLIPSQTQINPWVLVVTILLWVWSVPWKGYALWKAAGLKQKWWFIVLLLVNTIGVLEILYIFVFSKHSSAQKEETPKS